jgi:hypothetical protein
MRKGGCNRPKFWTSETVFRKVCNAIRRMPSAAKIIGIYMMGDLPSVDSGHVDDA